MCQGSGIITEKTGDFGAADRSARVTKIVISVLKKMNEFFNIIERIL